MHGQKRAQGKFPTEGASAPKRGAPNTRMMVVVKEEPLDGEPVTSSPRTSELLRKRIMDKREAQGLGRLEVQFVASAKHALTPDEIERRERRKEQNRRAARRCRMKKRLQQNSVAQNHAQLQATIREQENEIIQLREKNAFLEKTLQDRALSGQHPVAELKTDGVSDVMLVSSVPAPVSTSASSVAPYNSQLAALMSSATPTETPVDLETYLDGLFPLLPDETFTDVSQFMNLEGNIPSLSSSPSPPPPPSCTSIPSSQQPLPPPPSSSSPGPMESLKTLMPSSPQTSCINQSLLSPATSRDRRSVSSTASDWSPASELSQGFNVPSASVGSPGSQGTGGGSSGDSDAMDNASSPTGFSSMHQRLVPEIAVEIIDDDDEEDDVFSRGDVSATITDEVLFQQYFKKN